MNDRLDHFNWIAPHYNAISRLVFGNTIYHSQLWALKSLPPGSAILVLGGGSGEILPALVRINPSCMVWFVEASSNMLSRASAVLAAEEKKNITFIHGTEKAIPSHLVFDVVITNFLLDLFPDAEAGTLCRELIQKIGRQGLWFVADFKDGGKWWQRLLLWTMYRFFVITCKIGAVRLPAWENHLQSVGLVEKQSKHFYGGFIKSIIYQRGK
jgi:ubiquinone/menaquinone biosynthesis C-methylase UbiE